MAIQSLFPNIAPTLDLSFALTKKLDPRITFSRASSGKFFDGRTVAKAEENLVIRSQEFDNAGWTTDFRLTISANTGDTTAPDGTSTAEKFTETVDNGTHRVRQSVAFLAGTYVLSFFIKKGTRQWVWLGAQDNSNNAILQFFDLDSIVTGATSDVSSVMAIDSASIWDQGNNWRRCVLTFSISSAQSNGVVFGGLASADGTNVYAGATDQYGYFWGAQLEQRASVTAYTPTTTQPITNYIPVLQSAADNVARFDHSPTTAESLGFLVEESRSNLLTYSEQFDNAAWTKTRSSITANTIVAPDGTLTGDKLIANTDNDTHHVQRGATVFASSVNTISVYMKAGEYSFGSITVNNGSVFPTAYYNLTDGTVGNFSSGASGSIQPAGNGWYRCSLTFTMASGVSTSVFILPTQDGITQSYAGNGYSGIFIWGAQLEAGAFPTSYIPTVASQVTRAADAASITGANFTSFYNAGENTLYVETAATGAKANQYFVKIQDSLATSNYIVLRQNASNTQFTVQASSLSGITAGLSGTNFSVGVALKAIVSVKPSSVLSSISAGTVGSSTAMATMPIVDRMTFGGGQHIRKVSCYPKALIANNLQALTA